MARKRAKEKEGFLKKMSNEEADDEEGVLQAQGSKEVEKEDVVAIEIQDHKEPASHQTKRSDTASSSLFSSVSSYDDGILTQWMQRVSTGTPIKEIKEEATKILQHYILYLRHQQALTQIAGDYYRRKSYHEQTLQLLQKQTFQEVLHQNLNDDDFLVFLVENEKQFMKGHNS